MVQSDGATGRERGWRKKERVNGARGTEDNKEAEKGKWTPSMRAQMILRIVEVIALEGSDSKAVERRRQYGARELTVRGGIPCMIILPKELRWGIAKT